MARIMLIAEVNGLRVRGRQRLGWMDGVQVALTGQAEIGKSGEHRHICN